MSVLSFPEHVLNYFRFNTEQSFETKNGVTHLIVDSRVVYTCETDRFNKFAVRSIHSNYDDKIRSQCFYSVVNVYLFVYYSLQLQKFGCSARKVDPGAAERKQRSSLRKSRG